VIGRILVRLYTLARPRGALRERWSAGEELVALHLDEETVVE
jgi:hypothetical protein